MGEDGRVGRRERGDTKREAAAKRGRVVIDKIRERKNDGRTARDNW